MTKTDSEKIKVHIEQNGTRIELPLLKATHGANGIDISHLYKTLGHFTYDPGFVSTASCDSAITFIDGKKGLLRYRGYPIEQLAEQSNFTETCHLLYYGELPSAEQQKSIDRTLAENMAMDEAALSALQKT